MKKIVWIVVGVVVVASVVLIGRERSKKGGETDGVTTEYTEGTERPEAVKVPDVGITTKDTKNTKGSESVLSEQSVDGIPPELSDPVKALLGLDGMKHNYPELLKAINDLNYELSAADVSALMEMLNFPNDRFPENMRPIEINAVKNDVLDKLLRQKQLAEGLGMQMAEMADNAENDPVWRDYCVQFMAPFYERSSAESMEMGVGNVEQTFQSAHQQEGQTGKSAPQTERSAIHDAMFSALEERADTLAGTALIGLENLSRTHDEFDRETIASKATEIAGDEMASAASRMTALRLAAMMDAGESAVVGAARSLAQTGETVLLRSAAIVTLGEIGTPDDRELLESYALADNRQIASAAKMALAKMDAQLDPSVVPGKTDVVSETTSVPQITKKVAPILINRDI